MSTVRKPPSHATSRKLTYDDYARLPDDGKRYQVLEGELDVTPAPTPKHQVVAFKLARLLADALEDKGLGQVYVSPIDVLLGPHDIAQPDIVFISKARLDIVKEKNIQGAPDLVVEILSPSTSRTDRIRKSRVYASNGVPSYWIVDPIEESIQLLRLAGELYQLAAVAERPEIVQPAEFPGLEIDLDAIFTT